jgi:hypothetical protein
MKNRIIEVQIDESTNAQIEVQIAGNQEEDVAFKVPKFDDVVQVIASIGKKLDESVSSLNPSKVTFEFGLSFALNAGTLTAVILDGKSESSIKVKLEWDK